MKTNIKSLLTATLLCGLLLVNMSAPVHAALITQSIGVTAVDPATDPIDLGQPTVIHTKPLSDTLTTQSLGREVDVTDDASTELFAWNIDTSNLCTGAEVTSVRVSTMTTTGPGHASVGDGPILMVVQSDAPLGVPTTITEGFDASPYSPGSVWRGITSLTGDPAVTAAGTLDATWTGMTGNAGLRIQLVQDNNVNIPSAWMQTEITGVWLTYDDAACSTPEPQNPNGPDAPADTSTPAKDATSLADTGAPGALYVTGAATLFAALIITLARRRTAFRHR